MRALIVDDEAPARRRLARMLGSLPDVEVVGELENGDALTVHVAEVTPDVLFVDVRMPGIDGVSLVRQHPDLPPVVFVTAYDEYAVRAFEVEALDYLVKPVRLERLAAAVERVRRRAVAHTKPHRAVDAGARVTCSGRGSLEVFDVDKITRFWASQKYTVFVAGGQEHMTEESLSALEKRLRAHGFVRVHRAELIRASTVMALRAEVDGHVAELCDGQCARVSRRCVAMLKDWLGQFVTSG